MSPTLNDGDYIFINKPRSFRVGFIYVLNHDRLGRIVKRLSARSENGSYFSGDNPASTSPERIGLIQDNQIMGRAVFAITPKGLRKL